MDGRCFALMSVGGFMRTSLKLLFTIVPMATLLVMYQQCSNVNFKNAVEQNQWSHECSQDASKCREVTEKFNSGTSNKKIDFVWVVDNSGSMGNEVQKTRDNMKLFAETLAGYTDLKMALVSAKDGTTNPGDSNPQYFTMPAAAITSTQVNTFVASNDALIAAGLVTCPANAAADSWCTVFQTPRSQNPAGRTDVDGRMIPDARWDKVYKPTAGALTGFMRDQSHKVFVIVSDDDARNAGNPYRVLSDQFLDAYDSRFPNSQPIVYSIVSPRTVQQAASAGCDVYGQGLEYIRLSGLTGGKVFDICANDWKPYFDEMLAGIETLARSSFPLATVNIVDIVSVQIYSKNTPNNKRTLASGEYTYANRTLTIRDDVVSGYTNFEIEVKLIEYTN